ncbi:hypothetical protein V8E51_007957 [Hyaloscypha variabilis]|uniref:Uncharacterized protein n=1 Tax=Hyaloscypha variabilis (strain UAMH 11265 / GT02V1 / F) TaxID=1149755 RepID=A0A2J6S000_HYAVF|nr:hypothetical protein L207DRAFT_271777 [Hyaloscypha variabilis F]
MPPKFNLNAKTVTAPLAAFTMATLLFVYSRTSIQAAKRNAQKHREADGGQINWHNESLRRHGKLESPVEEGTVGQLVGTLQEGRDKRGRLLEGEKGEVVETDAEKKVRERAWKRKP